VQWAEFKFTTRHSTSDHIFAYSAQVGYPLTPVRSHGICGGYVAKWAGAGVSYAELKFVKTESVIGHVVRLGSMGHAPPATPLSLRNVETTWA
jgi:hypothetical protein